MPAIHFPVKKTPPLAVSGIQTGRTDIKKIRVPRQQLLWGTLILFGLTNVPSISSSIVLMPFVRI